MNSPQRGLAGRHCNSGTACPQFLDAEPVLVTETEGKGPVKCKGCLVLKR